MRPRHTNTNRRKMYRAGAGEPTSGRNLPNVSFRPRSAASTRIPTTAKAGPEMPYTSFASSGAWPYPVFVRAPHTTTRFTPVGTFQTRPAVLYVMVPVPLDAAPKYNRRIVHESNVLRLMK